MKKTKTETEFTVVWDNDIPICKGTKPAKTTWQEIDWKQVERVVFKLQKRIYRASNCGDVKAVRRLQKTLIRSWAARLLATRRVTQDNQGKKTAGVDGIKSLTPVARLKLANNLRVTTEAKPTRRVWIPKPGTEEKRPLGIPTIYDRALQALVKLALEPEWEARFEENSYGFRPGRSCHDAIEAIFKSIRYKAKYVLDADIAKCFDKINQEALLKKIGTYPTLRKQLRAWLKAGCLDGKQLFPTSEGTPQGGVISPLLANIALHGMEERVKQYMETFSGSKKDNRKSISLIRYADDFVILHKDLAVVQRCKEIIEDWLKDMGLELKPSKTKLKHTFLNVEDGVGFDFLGFNVRQYPTGLYRCAKNTNGKTLGFSTLITPSKDKVKTHLRKMEEIISSHRNAPQEALISKLNPIIIGWSNYYLTVPSGKIFKKLDMLTFMKLKPWARSRGKGKVNKEKYWRNGWKFMTEDGKFVLRNHSESHITKHVKVQGTRSPYDGDWVYWTKRMGEYPGVKKNTSTLLTKQGGKCPHCGLYFKETDIVEVDHIKPKSRGGNDTYQNLQLLHRHCHDKKTTNDGSYSRIYDKDWGIEEPDEAKVSRPVL
jgi:RNA-directed DNA polymerase